MINANNIVDVRSVGYKVLAAALGPVGFVRFLQQYDNGSGRYTREKYEEPDDSEDWSQLEAKVKRFDDPELLKKTM